MLWRRRFVGITQPVLKVIWRITRGMTLGVRGVVTDGDGRVLLIQHTYVTGWHLPGGGIERGETAEEALRRELVEEAGVAVVGRPRLLSFHSNDIKFTGDHVLVYRIDAWSPCEATARGEIHERGWFAPDALPEGTTPGTRRRVAEALAGEDAHPHW